MEPNLILIIGLGTASSILPMIAAYFYANYIGSKVNPRKNGGKSGSRRDPADL